MAYLPVGMRPAQHLGSIPALPAPAPSNLYDIAEGVQWDMDKGSLIYNGMTIPVIPGILSALVVRAVLFGGSKVGGYAASKAKSYLNRKPA